MGYLLLHHPSDIKYANVVYLHLAVLNNTIQLAESQYKSHMLIHICVCLCTWYFYVYGDTHQRLLLYTTDRTDRYEKCTGDIPTIISTITEYREWKDKGEINI